MNIDKFFPPRDVPDVGRVCVVAGPAGAVARPMPPLNR